MVRMKSYKGKDGIFFMKKPKKNGKLIRVYDFISYGEEK